MVYSWSPLPSSPSHPNLNPATSFTPLVPFDPATVPDQMLPMYLLNDRAMQFLLLLLHPRGVGKESYHPFRQVLTLLVDDRLQGDAMSAGSDVESVDQRSVVNNQVVFVDFSLVVEVLLK